jgi:hypothetical protein
MIKTIYRRGAFLFRYWWKNSKFIAVIIYHAFIYRSAYFYINACFKIMKIGKKKLTKVSIQ